MARGRTLGPGADLNQVPRILRSPQFTSKTNNVTLINTSTSSGNLSWIDFKNIITLTFNLKFTVLKGFFLALGGVGGGDCSDCSLI